VSATEVQHGRELAAQAIEEEARAYEAQFGIDGRDGEAAGVLWMAAQIARGETLTAVECAALEL
jgi:hypothetical protein